MMKINFSTYTIFLALGSILLLNACEKEGPAENAGEKVDEAIEETEEEAREAKENIEEAVKD